jgi:hypothetical protein
VGGGLPAPRDQDLELEVGFCYAGSNRKRRAHPAAGSWLLLVVLLGSLAPAMTDA